VRRTYESRLARRLQLVGRRHHADESRQQPGNHADAGARLSAARAYVADER